VVNRIGRRNTAMVLAVIVLLATLGLIFAQGYLFLFLVFITAAAAGAPGAVWPTWTAENFGLVNNGANYGFVLIGVGISALVSFKIADSIAKATVGGADYVYFVIAAVMAVFSIVLIALFRPIKQKTSSK
jgi:MFS family permease